MSKPNILIFMTDQQRGASILGPNKAITPNIDQFRTESVTFSNAFCPSPHCCPSRASFFSGHYPTTHGVWNNVGVGNALSRGLAPDIRLWSEDFKEAGYEMWYAGKWHVSATEGPKDRGWNEGFVTANRSDGPIKQNYEWSGYQNIVQPEVREDGMIIRPGYRPYTHYGLTDDKFNDVKVVESGLEFLNSYQGDAPWCCYIGPQGPHDPYFVPQRFLDLYDINDIKLPDSFEDKMLDKPALYRRTRDRFDQLTEREHREALRHYLAFCSYQDELFGKVLETLKRRGEEENTLVLYTSDHGDYMADHGLWCKGLPCFRGAYEIPAVIRWPERLANPGRVVDDFVTLSDFCPTFLEILDKQPAQEIPGKSLLPFINDQRPTDWRDTVFTQSNGNELYGIQRSVMTKKWRFTYNGYDYDELYDLENDPDETINLIDKPELADIVKEMSGKMWKFAQENRDSCVNQYIMVALSNYGPGVAFE